MKINELLKNLHTLAKQQIKVNELHEKLSQTDFFSDSSFWDIEAIYPNCTNKEEDRHIENRMMFNYTGDVKRSLLALRKVHLNSIPTVSELEADEEIPYSAISQQGIAAMTFFTAQCL